MQPIAKVAWVIGINFRKPLKRRMSMTPPIECITLPAPKNNNALKNACVNKWNIPAEMPANVPVPKAKNM